MFPTCKYVKGFVLRPTNLQADLLEIYSSLSFVGGLILLNLLERDIPHNLLIADRGCTMYIIPRQHESKQANLDKLRCGFFEISGLAICWEKDFYDKLDKATFEEYLTKYVSLPDKEFDQIKEDLKKSLIKSYK